MDDMQLVDRLFRREEQVLQELDQKYRSYCGRIAQNILGNREDSEECVNDTWFQLWRLIPPNRPSSLQAFAGKITRGIAIDRLRKRSAAKRPDTNMAEVEREAGELAPVWNAVESAMEQKELAELLNRFLGELPPDERDIFVRRYWFMDSLADIAARHGTTVGSIRGKLYRNRNKLREFLRKNEVSI